MDNNKFTKEEKKVLRDYEAGNYRAVSNFKEEKKRHMDYAKATTKRKGL